MVAIRLIIIIIIMASVLVGMISEPSRAIYILYAICWQNTYFSPMPYNTNNNNNNNNNGISSSNLAERRQRNLLLFNDLVLMRKQLAAIRTENVRLKHELGVATAFKGHFEALIDEYARIAELSPTCSEGVARSITRAAERIRAVSIRLSPPASPMP